MVKTRHGGQMDESPGGEFLSLRTRSGKRISRSDYEDHLLTSGEESTPRTKRQRVVSIRASGSSSSPNETPVRAPHRRSYGRLDDDMHPASPIHTRSRNLPSSSPPVPTTPKNQEERRELVLSRSREYRSLTRDGYSEVIEVDDDDDGVRRSRRARKQIYGTMNQNLLAEMMLAGGANPSPEDIVVGRRRGRPVKERPKQEEEEEDDDDDDEEDEDEEDESEEGDEESNHKGSESGLDMYSRIKNRHIKKKLTKEEKKKAAEKEEEGGEEEEEEEDDDSDDSDEEEEDEDDDDDDESEEDEEEEPTPVYSLRQHRQTTNRYVAPVKEPHHRRQKKFEDFINPHSPLRRRHYKHTNHLTPVRSPRLKRKHHATHNSSSTSSDDSDDERRFERRKTKSMARARNRCLPMNLAMDDLSGVMKDRQRIGSSLADVDPMNIDTSVTFDAVGGLGSHVQALKEMVVFPLLYPEVFERFKIAPPRGVLFHGPPGTGKTLVARALANECKQGDRRVAFFMRKGADCLSKWVGESERQLRLLFDQAYSMRPSIIFFDEIDGLAPVRSSRQDQIHSSIVSTLLALMDGLDSRGEIVVIGATNRIDSIDPALRRPGRFDREFLFPLPSLEARMSILSIHTKEWNPKLSEAFLSELAEKCVGYCGADIKALCTEAALFALRRRYPQIYTSKEKLQLDVSQINLSARDFHQAMSRIVPASQRSVVSPGRSLSVMVQPLLQNQLNAALEVLHRVFPSALYQGKATSQQDISSDHSHLLDMDADGSEEDGPSIYDGPTPRGGARRHRRHSVDSDGIRRTFLHFSSTSFHKPCAHRPRFLITGQVGMAQSSHLAPALLHHMERLPVHCLDLPALYACSAKTPEESCAQVFREARRTCPSIIYIPHVSQWWEACTPTLQATFLTLLQDLPPSAPILLLATSDHQLRDMPHEVQALFLSGNGEVMMTRHPRMDERREFFRDLIMNQATKAPVKRKTPATQEIEVLPVAPPKEPRVLSQEEIDKLADQEERKLRELRIFLRDVLTRLATERKFRVFTSPVDPEEVPDYAEVIKNPMDLFTMNNKINLHHYTSARQFLADIDLITSNALEYNPDKEPSDRMIRNRACELKDMAYAIIDAEMDSDFEKACEEIEDSRTRRTNTPSKTAPTFYKTLHQYTLAQAQIQARELATQKVSSHQLEVDSRDRNGGDESVRRKKKQKKKPSTRRSAWSRGFLSKPKKKKRPALEDDGSEDESEQEKDGDEKTKDDEAGDVETEHEMQNHELHNGPLPNGDMFHQETSNDSVETSNTPSVLSQITDEGPASRTRHSSSTAPTGGHVHPTNNDDDSDRESVKSGPRTRHSSHSEHSESRKSPRLHPNTLSLSSFVANKHLGELQNGVNSEESSEIEPPTLELCEPLPNDRGDGSKSKDHDNDVVMIEDDEGDGLQKHQEVNKQETPTSRAAGKEICSDTETSGGRALRRSSRRMWASDSTQTVTSILEDSSPRLVVDRERLKRLLENVTIATASFTIEKLERLYSILSQCVYNHRMDFDKTELTEEMEREVSRITVQSQV